MDYGRLWYLTSNEELTASHWLNRSTYDHTLYYAHGENVQLKLMLATKVDYYLYTGSSESMEAFERLLKDTFEVIKLALSQL